MKSIEQITADPRVERVTAYKDGAETFYLLTLKDGYAFAWDAEFCEAPASTVTDLNCLVKDIIKKPVLYVAARETGDFIERVYSIEEGEAAK